MSPDVHEVFRLECLYRFFIAMSNMGLSSAYPQAVKSMEQYLKVVDRVTMAEGLEQSFRDND